jgi:uncharacterized repeat protein (TIGR03837 family)|tara:strand:+ start:1171 stop:2217 length:1047 start_codon:yes stop_codon:yes gene_type:complete
MKTWHIFSRAIDNFGDVAISLRLALQLSKQTNSQIILFTEFNSTLETLVPKVAINSNVFVSGGFEIRDIDRNFDGINHPTHIINIFNILIPNSYFNKISTPTRYIIYEYLSAERWVDNFHLKPSPSKNKYLQKIFFFPGFTKKTGGLLIEKDANQVIKKNLNFFLKNNNLIEKYSFSVFAYPHTNIDNFLDAIDVLKIHINMYLPELMLVNKKISRDKFSQLITYPFLSFDDFDNLLANCDINFVRGEDSLVRAIFSGKPFIWQPYLQDNDTHLEKLNAFIDFYFSDIRKPLFTIISTAFHDWATGLLLPSSLNDFIENIDEIAKYYSDQSFAMIAQKSAVNNLIVHC